MRDRIEDIPVLAEFILKRIAGDNFDTEAKLSEEAPALLQSYTFPENIRALKNILERALTLSDGQYMEINDIQLPSSEQTIHGNAVPDQNK